MIVLSRFTSLESPDVHWTFLLVITDSKRRGLERPPKWVNDLLTTGEDKELQTNALETDVECWSEPELVEPEMNDLEQVKNKEPEFETESTPITAESNHWSNTTCDTPSGRCKL